MPGMNPTAYDPNYWANMGGGSATSPLRPYSSIGGTSQPTPTPGFNFMDWLPSQRTMGQALGVGGLGLGVGGVLQQLLGRPPTGRTTYQSSPQSQAAIAGAQQQMGTAGQQLGLLNALLAQPQIPPALMALVQQANQPAIENILGYAGTQAQKRGFGPGKTPMNQSVFTEGPSGAIAGPLLGQLQGRMAEQSLGLYQNQIQNLLNSIGASQQGANIGYGGARATQPTITQQAPKPTLLDTLSKAWPIFQGAGSVLSKFL